MRFAALCDEFQDVFQAPGLAPHRPLDHAIDLVDENTTPPRHKQYRLSANELEVVQQHVDDMLAKGWIRPSISLYGAPILFVCKKTGELRMCVDFCSLNKQMHLDMFPIPHIHNLLNKFGKARIFSAVDLSSAYHQVCIKEGHKHKTAFLTLMSLFEYVVMPLSLTNAPATL